ncbi:penicillin-binding protein 1C [Camelimonas fluminis]|uniref:peptidoglycan glycosyltransferase n=1 Tax=Camelimonas fluminis TaxID=1576911 RepID=A0ABV7UC45_9HYPH|nr:transglycosylase domain-containing protein [Camelimonas fluminis]GHE48558.1 penicillin-binding protein 1C [Camelimonas fluminis]
MSGTETAGGTASGGRRGRLLRRLGLVALLLTTAGAGAGYLALQHYAASLGPIDLSVLQRTSPLALDRDGRLLRAFATPEGRWRLPVKLTEVDPHFINLLKAYEDRRFDAHGGVDPFGVARAAWQLARNGRVVSGASTLSMQAARLLEPREARSFSAKLRQMVRAVQLERRLGKEGVLVAYLTLAPYGGNIEGVRAASLIYFGKEPARLSTAEAALLVALPQSPEARRPDRNPAAAGAARARVLQRGLEAGALVAAETERASAAAMPAARRALPMLAPHLAEQAIAAQDGGSGVAAPVYMAALEPEAVIALVPGAPGQGAQVAPKAGTNVTLAIDARLQAALQALAEERAAGLGRRISAAIVVVDNATGEVRAHVGSPDYFDAERAGAVDASRAVRSPGSALKPFIYGLAFEQGLAHPETVLDDRPSRYGAWAPENFEMGFLGTVSARKALQMSLNLPAVELLSELGAPQLLARLRGAGARLAMPDDASPGLAVGLGGLGVSLVDLTMLYVGLARGGDVVPLRWRLDDPVGQTRRLTDPVAAWYVADALREAPPPANAVTGRIAFKTGTSWGYRDAWAIGYDRRYTVGVWLGRADGASVPGLVGRVAAAPVLFDAFARIGGEPQPLPQPPGVLRATAATLPPPLRHLRKGAPKTIAATLIPPLRISFPPDGSSIDLGAGSGGALPDLALRANGGAPPLRWFVNGAPVGEAQMRRQSFWKPDGAGFARVSVMDSRGTSDSVQVRIE